MRAESRSPLLPACGAMLLVAAMTALAADPPDALVVPRSLNEAIAMEKADALPRTALYEAPDLGATKPGALLKSEPFTGYAVPDHAHSVRILYHSLDAEGRPVATSGVVLIPAGKAPPGGWPVIAWAHGTSGVARQCAPSLMKDMEYGEEGLMPMVRAGFAVVATDYHGLGTDGPHQYVNRIAQARDVIYSIPAAHAAVPDLAPRWVAIGHSQGGLAAWGVAEMQADLKDPNYLGAISVAGTAEISELLGMMGGSVNEATFYLTYMAYGVKARTPSFDVRTMLDGAALKHYAAATTQGCWNYAYGAFLGAKGKRSLKPGWEKLPAVQTWGRENATGTQPIGGAFFVIGGEADMTVPFTSLKATTIKACQRGIALTYRSYPGLDHDPTMAVSLPDQLAWVRERMAGTPAKNSCPELTAP
jgi:pimeloyl-ACP methyl ester carboxylesterase